MEQAMGEAMERWRSAAGLEVTPRRAEMRRVADRMRQVIERLVATSAPLEALTAAADGLEAVVAALEGYPQGHVFEGFAETANAGDPYAFFDYSPIIGLANPIAPPLVTSIEAGTVVGRGTFGSAYEGPPGSVHGGHVAAAFDEVLGMTQSLAGTPGMTGTLTIRYRRPTPLHKELRFVGRLDRVDGRKIYTLGECYDGDTLTAEAEGIFISVDWTMFRELIAKRDPPG